MYGHCQKREWKYQSCPARENAGNRRTLTQDQVNNYILKLRNLLITCCFAPLRLRRTPQIFTFALPHVKRHLGVTCTSFAILVVYFFWAGVLFSIEVCVLIDTNAIDLYANQHINWCLWDIIIKPFIIWKSKQDIWISYVLLWFSSHVEPSQYVLLSLSTSNDTMFEYTWRIMRSFSKFNVIFIVLSLIGEITNGVDPNSKWDLNVPFTG